MMILCLLLLLQDAELDEARQSEIKRIAGKPQLNHSQISAYAVPDREKQKTREKATEITFSVVHIVFPGEKEDPVKWKAVLERTRQYYKKQSGGTLTLQQREVRRLNSDFSRKTVESWKPGSREEKEWLSAAYQKSNVPPDRIVFVVSGTVGLRASALWPHEGTFSVDRKRLPYVLTLSDVRGFEVGALAHELGHLFGLPDKYEDPDRSAGPWCLMGTGYQGQKGDPKHDPLPLCGVCKVRLGWVASEDLDLRRESRHKQESIEKSKSVYRVPLKSSAEEALIFETREKKGMIVWHVQKDRTTAFLGCFPTQASDRLTPFSEPSFRGQTMGSRVFYLTDIRFEKGVSYFQLAPAAELTPLEKLHRSRVGRRVKR